MILGKKGHCHTHALTLVIIILFAGKNILVFLEHVKSIMYIKIRFKYIEVLRKHQIILTFSEIFSGVSHY